MITKIGKVLVFAALILSVMFAAWALGLYTNRIDWPGGSVGIYADKVEGEYNRRKKEVQDRQTAAGLALSRWQSANAVLVTLENQVPVRQAWYAAKLNSLRMGQGNVTSLAFDNAGKLLLNNQGPPIVAPDNQPLNPRQFYIDTTQTTEDDIRTQNNQSTSLFNLAKEHTLEINGIPGMEKGLRDLLREGETNLRNTLEELEYLRPFRYNRQAEAEMLQKRQETLKTRLGELNRAAQK